MMQSKNSAIAIIAVILVSSISLVIWINNDDDEPELNLEDYGPSASFTLTGTSGDNVTFSDYTGKVRLVTFIYTACTQGCSINTLKMMNILYNLNTEYKSEIEFFVIDFDYMHDNLTTLKHYSETLAGENGVPTNLNFVWGNKDQINTTAKDWEFVFELQSGPMMNMSTDMTMTETTTDMTMTETSTHTGDDDMHSGHEIVWIHPFVVYLIDQDDVLRKKIWGLDWQQSQVENLIEKLL